MAKWNCEECGREQTECGTSFDGRKVCIRCFHALNTARKEREYRMFANTMAKVARLQRDLCADDLPNVAAHVIDWDYIAEWAENLLARRKQQ